MALISGRVSGARLSGAIRDLQYTLRSRRPPACRLCGKPRLNSSLASSSYIPGQVSSSGGVTSESDAEEISGTPRNLSAADRYALEAMLRVDHAGEIAANTIYQAQADVFGALGDVKSKELMLEMWSTERKHLQVAQRLLTQHRVRPSALLPMWSLAGRVLGGVTAMMGKEAAMACTEAVETVIGEHYDDQLLHLQRLCEDSSTLKSPALEGVGTSKVISGEVHPSIPLLTRVITEFRDDELEHLDTAVEHDAQQAPAHALLSAVIGWGCKGAIGVAKRI